MSDKDESASATSNRQRRLAEALRANLRRRKQQSRARRTSGTERSRPDAPQDAPGSDDVST